VSQRAARNGGGIATVLLALTIATLAFAIRFNALGGSLGGFDNDEFFILTRADAILDGEQPLRDFSDGELRAAWPSLSYQVPAWTEQVWGRSLLVYAWLVCGALALCAAMVFVVARGIAGGWIVPLTAALAVIASYAKPYNYPKLLTLCIAIALVRRTVAQPTTARIALLAAWTVVAALFRQDYGVYVAVAAIVALTLVPGTGPPEGGPYIQPEGGPYIQPEGGPYIQPEGGPYIQPEGGPYIRPKGGPYIQTARRVGLYIGLGLLFALPSAIWIAYYKGIPHYITDILASVRGEGRRLVSWPVVDMAHPLATDSLIALLYYVFWAVPIVAIVFLIVSCVRRSWDHHAALGMATILLALLVNYFFLRGNLPARFGDAVVPIVLLVAWMAGLWSQAGGGSRFVARAAASALLVLMIAAFFPINSIASELRTDRFNSVSGITARFAEVSDLLRDQPPVMWRVKPRDGSMAVARYLAECTAPDDRVLVATNADEIPYFATRRFAGGQGSFYSNLLKSDEDQRLVLQRLAGQSVPVVVSHPNYHDEFAVNYPLVAQYIAAGYRDVGVIDYDGKPVLRVFVESARTPIRVDPVLGYPCFQ